MLEDVAQRLPPPLRRFASMPRWKGCTIDIKYDDDDTVNAFADGKNHVTVLSRPAGAAAVGG